VGPGEAIGGEQVAAVARLVNYDFRNRRTLEIVVERSYLFAQAHPQPDPVSERFYPKSDALA
jgi:hypothetical protein